MKLYKYIVVVVVAVARSLFASNVTLNVLSVWTKYITFERRYVHDVTAHRIAAAAGIWDVLSII